jgi:two-component system response regulator WspF
VTPLRIAIVDDLALARAVLRRVIASVPGYQVAWEANDGAQALAKVLADKPDVLLMDLVMPVLDGAEATKQIMANSPLPILIVTSSISTNLNRVFEALSHGGLDAINTPTLGPDGKLRGEGPLLARLATIAKPSAIPIIAKDAGVRAVAKTAGPRLVAIGASTGGPEAVARVLTDLGPTNAAVVVVQHIGADFIKGLAEWLSTRLGVKVALATNGVRPAGGSITLAGGDEHLTLDSQGIFKLSIEPQAYPYRPSADVFFESLPGTGVAVLLTGMGSDGARGLLSLRQHGWHTIAQDEATSVVYGMPKAAAQINAAVEVLPLNKIGAAIRSKLSS